MVMQFIKRTPNMVWNFVFHDAKNEEWDSTMEETISTYKKLLMKARDEVKIVCGECNPELFEQEGIIEALRILLQCGGQVDLVFAALNQENPNNQAITRFHHDNPRLCELLAEYPTKARLYLMYQPSKLYYTIVDKKHCFFEDVHDAYWPRKSHARFDDEKLGKAWESRFDQFLKIKLNRRKMVKLKPGDVCKGKAQPSEAEENRS